jgi:Ca2+:H+ antiporter
MGDQANQEPSSDAPAFNTYQLRNAANRIGRHHNIFKLGRGEKRRNTINDAERGNAGEPGVVHRSTAPGGISNDRVANGRPTSKDNDKDIDRIGSSEQTQSSTFDSQATTSHSPPLNGSLVHRKNTADDMPNDVNPGLAGSTRSHEEPHYTVGNQLQRTLLNSWINVLLLAIPAGFALEYAHIDGKIVFTVNFLAIIPLAAMLSYATEEIAHRTGETLGGLINATFGYVRDRKQPRAHPLIICRC